MGLTATRTRLNTRRLAVGAAGAAAGPAERKAALVASLFVRDVHACRRAGTHAGSATASKSECPCLNFRMSLFAMPETSGRVR